MINRFQYFYHKVKKNHMFISNETYVIYDMCIKTIDTKINVK